MLTHAICGICVKRSLIIHFIISKPTHLSLVLINTHQLVKSLIVEPSKRLLGCFQLGFLIIDQLQCDMQVRLAPFQQMNSALLYSLYKAVHRCTILWCQPGLLYSLLTTLLSKPSMLKAGAPEKCSTPSIWRLLPRTRLESTRSH